MADIDTIAAHEAGHAVMRWLTGRQATRVTASESGGMCAGTGKVADTEDVLLVMLAGIAAETGYGLFAGEHFGDDGPGGDVTTARKLLLSERYWRLNAVDGVVEDVETALRRWLDRAGEMLWPHDELIQEIAFRLIDHGRVSARSVAALCREHGKRFAWA